MGIENPVHLLFIAAVALIVLGPKRLPEVAKALGHGIREFRDAVSQADAPHVSQPPVQAAPMQPPPYTPPPPRPPEAAVQPPPVPPSAVPPDPVAQQQPVEDR